MSRKVDLIRNTWTSRLNEIGINTLRGYRNQRNQKKTPVHPTRYL